MYRVPVLENFAWQEAVTEFRTTDTGLTPAKGDRYVVGVGADGFVGQDNNIAWYDGSAWQFDTPKKGWRVYNKANDTYYFWDGLGWTDKLVIGDLTVNGDINTPNASDWDLRDNDATALSFDTAGMVGHMLNFDTTDNNEVLSTDATFQAKGILDVDNDVNMETRATAFDLKQNETAALTFDTTSLAGILSIDTTSGAERVQMSNDLVVQGDLTVNGTTTTIDSQTLVIEDNLITLNKGGAVSSGGGAGIEIEENGVATGYIKSAADRAGFEFNAPANDFIGSLDFTATSTMTINGNLDVEAASAINQDVTTDAIPQFAGLDLDGDLNMVTQATDVDMIPETADALSFDDGGVSMMTFDTLNDKILASVPFESTSTLSIGGTFTLENGATITNSTANSMTLSDGDTTVTVDQARKAYDSRAQYDSALGLVVFDQAMLDAV